MERREHDEPGCNELSHHSKESVLSAKELIDVYNLSLDKKPNYRFSNSMSKCNEADTGAKFNNPSGTWLETNRTQTRLRSLFQQVSIPKVAQKGQLSEAIWDNSLMKAKVTKSCGKHWNVMGHTHENSLYIYLEEALFLLECNSLELIHDSIAISVQQAFQLLTSKKSDCSLENYLTYSKLTRLGYKVVRHNQLSISSSMLQTKDNKKSENVIKSIPSLTIADMKSGNNSEPPNNLILLDVPVPIATEEFIEIDTIEAESSITNSDNKHRSKQKKRNVSFNQNDKLDESNLVCEHLIETLIRNVLDTTTKNSSNKVLKTVIYNISAEKSPSNDRKMNKASQNEDEVEVLSDSEVARIDSLSMLPNCYNRTKVTLTVPPLDLLPNRAWPKKKVYIIDILRPQLLSVIPSNIECSDNDNFLKGNSLAVLDNDVEIINVVPVKSSHCQKTDERFTTRDSSFEISSDTIASRNLFTKFSGAISAQQSRKGMEVHDEKPEKRQRLISAHECSIRTNHKPKVQHHNEISNLVYNKMVEEPKEFQSRGYYPDNNFLLGNQRRKGSTKRKRTPEEISGKNSDHSRQIIRQAESIDLDFHPNKRLPVSNPNQCLPCDADTMNWLVQRYQEHHDNSAVMAQKNCNLPGNLHSCNNEVHSQELQKHEDSHRENNINVSKVINY